MARITTEETARLLNAVWSKARVRKPISAFGSRLEVGMTVLARPYHNDPDGYVSIRFTDEDGELHEFTETDDRVDYVEGPEFERLLDAAERSSSQEA